MQYRTLGRTGIKVSPYCLGAMMFGAMGNRDHDESIGIIHRALAGAESTIDDETLDQIDEIVPPGSDVSPLDMAYAPPALGTATLRRRPVGDRAAA